MQCCSLITCSIISFYPPPFPVFNVARLVTPSYMYQKFIVVSPISPPRKTAWEKWSLLPVTIFSCPKYPQPLLKSRGALYIGVNMLPERIVLHMLILFSLKSKHILRSWFTDGDNMLNHLNLGLFELILFYPNSEHILRYWFIYWNNMLNNIIVHRTQQNINCFCYIWLLIRLLLNKCLMIPAWSQFPYNQDYYCFVCINPW